MSQFPVLSIIIPTHNRSTLLHKGLAALEQQTWPKADFEVLVVADTCHDDTTDMVMTYSQQSSYPLNLLSHSAKNASATRNLGAANAQGDILLFLDDDIIAHPSLIQTHIEAQYQDSVVLGYSKPKLPEKPSWWQYNARLWWEDTYQSMQEPGHRFTYRDFFSGNVSMSKTLFDKVGGFDTSITGRLEDYELGMRLLKAGAKFRHVPKALGYHYDTTDLNLWLRRVYQEGVADVQICERNPELRNILFGDFEVQNRQWGRIREFIRRLAFVNVNRGDWLGKILLALATLSEQYLRSRGAWWHIMGVAREYNYWRGVAATIGGEQTMAAWLQEAPMPPVVASDAPVLDVVALPADEILQQTLNQATSLGLRLTVEGIELLTIPPQPGAEPLREEHLQSVLRNLTKQQFVPALALELIHSTRGMLC